MTSPSSSSTSMPTTACSIAGAVSVRSIASVWSVRRRASVLSKCELVEPRPVIAILAHGGEKWCDIEGGEARSEMLGDGAGLECGRAVDRQIVGCDCGVVADALARGGTAGGGARHHTGI